VSFTQPVFEARLGHGGRTYPGDQERGQHPAVHVVEAIATAGDEGLVVTGHSGEHARAEQQPGDRHEITAFFAVVQGEGDARLGQGGVGGERDDALREPAQGDLGFSALKGREGEAGQHVAPAAEEVLTALAAMAVLALISASAGAGAAAGVGVVAGHLPQPDHGVVSVQGPACLSCEPVAQPGRVAPGQGECLLVWAFRSEQRVAQQGPDAAAAFVFLLLAEEVGQAAQRGAPSSSDAIREDVPAGANGSRHDGTGAVRSVMVTS